tara:strand:- start:41 stop:688 length:648 start_codon:yes stop_codon:yes gene_type:complete
MKLFKHLRESSNFVKEAKESSNQIKKIKIIIGSKEAMQDPEWKSSGFGKIESEITLAMGDHSKDCFALAPDIGEYNGLDKKEAENYDEKPTDTMIYGMSNIMNGGQDIYFWTNGNRLKGAVSKNGLWPALFEQVSHEMVHIARLIATKHILKPKLGKEWYKGEGGQYIWPPIDDTEKKGHISEQAFSFMVGESIQQMITEFLKMAEKYLPELKGK